MDFFSIQQSSYQDPIQEIKGTMPVSNSPRAYGRVRNPLLKKENKNYKKLQERKFTKTKAKEMWCPSPNAP